MKLARLLPLVLFALVTGCSASSSSSSASCLDVPSSLTSAIAAGASTGSGLTPIKASAVKSPDFSQVYFVAMKFSATGVGDSTGVWATNSLDGTGSIMAVDGFAKQFTTWVDASTTQAAIQAGDPSVAAAERCLS